MFAVNNMFVGLAVKGRKTWGEMSDDKDARENENVSLVDPEKGERMKAG